jgi:prepilin-type processing-associated H-X9-DG protein
VRALVEDLGPEQGPWTSRLRTHLENTVAPGSRIPQVEVEVDTSHPFATGDSKLGLTIHDIQIEGGAGGMSFADGHAEIRKWTDKNLLNPAANRLVRAERGPDSDLEWLARRTTERRYR